MSLLAKIAAMSCAMSFGLRGLGALAIITILSGCASALAASDVPYVGEIINAGERAGDMSPAQIWAIVACASFACFVLLGWGVFHIGTTIQTKLATLEEQNRTTQSQLGTLTASKGGPCSASDAIHALVNTARTEIEQTGIRVRRGIE